MNSTQVILLLAPGALGYLYWIWKGESNNRINHWANLFSGLIVVPLFVGFMPFILLGVSLDLLRKSKWGEAIMPLIFLLLIIGYGGLIIHLRDPVPPVPWDLPVEKPVERQRENPIELPVEK